MKTSEKLLTFFFFILFFFILTWYHLSLKPFSGFSLRQYPGIRRVVTFSVILAAMMIFTKMRKRKKSQVLLLPTLATRNYKDLTARTLQIR